MAGIGIRNYETEDATTLVTWQSDRNRHRYRYPLCTM